MKAFAFEAALLKALARAAGARIIAAELFDKFLVAVDDAVAALDGGLAVESPSGACSSIQKLKSWFLRAI
jgi:hypothetical protein